MPVGTRVQKGSLLRRYSSLYTWHTLYVTFCFSAGSVGVLPCHCDPAVPLPALLPIIFNVKSSN